MNAPVSSKQRLTPEKLAEFRELVPFGSHLGVGGSALALLLDEIETCWAERKPDETSRDADDAWRYRYLKSHLGLGWGVKLAGGDPHGFAGPTLLDKALDAARGAVDDYGCTGCRSTPCICSQLEPSGEEARLWQDQATNFKDQAEYWRLKYEATLPLCGCKSGPCLKQTGVRCALEEPSRLPEPMPERCPCNRADCIKCHPPGLSMAPTAQPPDWYCPNCDCDLCGAVQGRLERSAENGSGGI